MRRFPEIFGFFLVFSVLFLPGRQIAAEELNADTIIDKSYNHNVFDFDSATADMKMILIVKDTKVVEERKVRVKASRKDDRTRTVLHFVEPEDVSGMAFLYLDNKDRNDDQWLYMPALKKAIRKGGESGKSESFIGTEFTYGDMESRDVKDYSHKKLPDEKIGPFDCYVIESIPKDTTKVQYGKLLTWVEKNTFIPRRVIFHEIKHPDKILKVMSAEKVETVDGKTVITQTTMRNMKNRKATRLMIENINTKAQIPEEDFTVERITKM